jgi:molybdopterin-guanine dinucleotide biosynthesis protein A
MIGVVLAGGAGTRMGGGKPSRPCRGTPLIGYPLAALGGACERVAVVAKADTVLPPLGGAERWDEPAEPRHPLTGIVHALERAGEDVLVCAADMPYVTADACSALIKSRAMAESDDGVLQPVLGVYLAEWLPALRAAPEGAPLTRTVEALAPRRLALPAALVRSIDTPEELMKEEGPATHEG